MDIYCSCLNEIQNKNNIEFEFYVYQNYLDFQKNKNLSAKKILDLYNRVEELIKDFIYEDNLYQEDWYQIIQNLEINY